MVDSRIIFPHARPHPLMEILLVLTALHPPTHFCHAVLIPKLAQRDNNAQYDCHQYDEDNSTRVQESDDDSDNTLDYKADYEDILNEGEGTTTAVQCLPNYKQRSNASVHKFQVMLLDIVYKHKASLKMYDDIC